MHLGVVKLGSLLKKLCRYGVQLFHVFPAQWLGLLHIISGIARAGKPQSYQLSHRQRNPHAKELLATHKPWLGHPSLIKGKFYATHKHVGTQ